MDKNLWWIIAVVAVVLIIGGILAMAPKDNTDNQPAGSSATSTSQTASSTQE